MSFIARLSTSSAQETMLAQAVNSHNLANASTPGFRADLIKFSDEYVNEQGRPRALNTVDFSEGDLHVTNRPLDVALKGDGWIAVEGADGSEGFTRRGDLQIDANGGLFNGAGRRVMGNAGPIAMPPFSEINIGTDGTISIRPVGQGANALAVVDRIRLVRVDNEQLQKGPDGLLRLPEGMESEESNEVQLLSGTLENSNVNPIESMVKMIDLARRFEAQIKIMQASEETEQSMTTVMRIS